MSSGLLQDLEAYLPKHKHTELQGIRTIETEGTVHLHGSVAFPNSAQIGKEYYLLGGICTFNREVKTKDYLGLLGSCHKLLNEPSSAIANFESSVTKIKGITQTRFPATRKAY